MIFRASAEMKILHLKMIHVQCLIYRTIFFLVHFCIYSHSVTKNKTNAKQYNYKAIIITINDNLIVSNQCISSPKYGPTSNYNARQILQKQQLLKNSIHSIIDIRESNR